MLGEEHLYIAAEMVHAFLSGSRPLLRLSQNERALQHALRVQSKAGSGPRGLQFVFLNCLRDIRLECRCVIADAEVAGLANERRRLVRFLHHGAHQAGEFGQFAVQQRFAEVDVGEDALQRIGRLVIRSGREESAGLLVPASRCGQCEIFFAGEVMKEAPFGEVNGGADIIDTRRGIAARAY